MAAPASLATSLGAPMAVPMGNATALGMAQPNMLAQAIQPQQPQAETDPGHLPGLGVLPGQLFLNPAIAPKVAGQARPFAPGEYVKNPDGSWSSEVTMTTGVGDYPTLNGGAPTVIPTLWIIDGKPTRVDEDTAANLAVQSGLQFRSFKTPDEAEAFSNERESQWQTVEPQNAGSIPALWGAPPQGGQ